MEKISKRHAVNPFFFKDMSRKDMVDLLNKEFPIKLIYNEELIDRISEQYPLIEKYKVAIIVLNILNSLRELLVLGKVLNFTKMFSCVKLMFFAHHRGDVILPSLKVKMTTPKVIRKHKDV